MTLSSPTLHPVLIAGGSGAVGVHAVRALRRLQPDLPLAIGARDMSRATALAKEVGHARAVPIDLARPDLGLPADDHYSAVLTLLKDERLSSLHYAQAHRIPHVAFADFVFDIGPAVARHLHARASPVLMLGQFLGGTMAMATLHFARDYERLDAIHIGAVMDEDDTGGPAAQADFERLGRAPRPLILKAGRFLWAEGDDLTRSFSDSCGTTYQGEALPLLDVASLSAATDAQSIRIDLAFRPRGEHRSNTVIIDLEGVRRDGRRGASRHELTDANGYSAQSGRGAALAVERMLGLAGGPPVGDGLHQPESLLEPAHVMARLQEFGTEVRTTILD